MTTCPRQIRVWGTRGGWQLHSNEVRMRWDKVPQNRAGERAEWLKSSDFQRTCIWSSEATLGSSQLRLTLAPVVTMLSSGFCGHMYMHGPQRHISMHRIKTKIANIMQGSGGKGISNKSSPSLASLFLSVCCGRAGLKFPGILLDLPSQCWDRVVFYLFVCLLFTMVSRASNSGPHACEASSLSDSSLLPEPEPCQSL